MFTLLSFIFSLGAVILGAKLFLSSSVLLSRLLRLPEMVIGATLVSLVTTMPESLVSLFASLNNHPFLALGNVIGSGLVNLGLLLGIILLTGQGSEVHGGRGRRRSLALFFLVFFLWFWFLIFGQIGFWGGVVLISLAFAFLSYTFWYASKEAGESLLVMETKLETHPKVVFKLLLGALFLILGARFLVLAGVNLARILGLPEIIIGLTLIAVGTSIPELLTALTALASGHPKISLGNLTGATVLTFTLALGLAAVITEVKITPEILKFDFPFLLFFSGLTLAWTFFPRLPQRGVGGVLVGGYFLYLVALFWL